jgi:polygalacturonase
MNCENIRIENVTVQNSPFWTLHILYSKNALIKNVKVFNPVDAITTDAIDIDSSENCLIEYCLFDVGDDAITLKSGSGEDGMRVNLPTKNVTAKNCTVLASHGGIALGSETAGSIYDVTIENCSFLGTTRAVRLKTRRGRGGTIKDINLKNLEMEKNLCPIVLGMYFQPGLDAEKDENKWFFLEAKQNIDNMTPIIQNITIENVNAKDCRGLKAYIVGLPESPIENLKITNFQATMIEENKMENEADVEVDSGVYKNATQDFMKIVNANLTEKI